MEPEEAPAEGEMEEVGEKVVMAGATAIGTAAATADLDKVAEETEAPTIDVVEEADIEEPAIEGEVRPTPLEGEPLRPPIEGEMETEAGPGELEEEISVEEVGPEISGEAGGIVTDEIESVPTEEIIPEETGEAEAPSEEVVELEAVPEMERPPPLPYVAAFGFGILMYIAALGAYAFTSIDAGIGWALAIIGAFLMIFGFSRFYDMILPISTSRRRRTD